MTRVALGTIVHDLHRLAGPPTADLPDEELLDAFRRGRDEAAFAALVGRHAALVMGVCRRTLGQA